MTSAKQREYENTVAEEASAPGQRATGAATHVFGSFRDRESAERAYNSISQRGFGRDQVNLLMSDDTRRKFFPEDEENEFHSKAMEGAGAGAAIGGAAVGILGAVVTLGTTIAIPGLGLVLAGPLVAGLAGVGAGSVAGGLIGALVGWGIPEHRAEQYERDIKEGAIVMSVASQSDDEASFVESEWKKHRGRNISR